MLHRPLKARHFSRYGMGYVFLACGLLLTTVHVLAGSVFLLLAAIVLYYAPRWNLSLETGGDSLRFSENVLETKPVEIFFSELLEMRRVEEKESRKGFLSLFPEYHDFVEFELQSGKIYRMHDIFSQDCLEEMQRLCVSRGVKVAGFEPEDAPANGLESNPDVE